MRITGDTIYYMVFVGNLSAIEVCSFGPLEIGGNGRWGMVT